MPKTTERTIELTPYQQELKDRYTAATRLVGPDGFYTVRVQVGNQQFNLAQEFELVESEWVRDMLAKALHRLIITERGDSYGTEQPTN